MSTRLIAGPPHAVEAAAPEFAEQLRAWLAAREGPAPARVAVEDAGGRVTVHAIERVGEAYALRKRLIAEGREVDRLRVV